VTVDEALKVELRAHAGLSALIGPRAYPVKLPPDCALPAVSFQFISRVPAAHTMVADPTLTSQRVQINSWGATPDSAVAVADEVEDAIRDFMGTLGGEEGVAVSRIFFESSVGPMEDVEGDCYGVKQDYIIWVD